MTRTWSADRSEADYISAPLFLACPTLYYVYQFNTFNFGIGAGFLLSALAVYVFVNKAGVQRLLAAPIACVAISVYQAFLPVLLVMYLVYVLLDIVQGGKRSPYQHFSLMLYFVSVLLLALILNTFVLKIFLIFMGIEVGAYLGLWVNFQPDISFVINTIQLIFVEMAKFYSGSEEVYAYAISPLKYLSAVLVLLSLAAILTAKQSVSTKLFAIMILGIIPVIPFSLHVMNGGAMPFRTMLAFPCVLGGLTFVAAQVRLPGAKFILVALVIMVSFRFISVSNQMAFSSQLAYAADRDLTVRLLSRMDTLGLSRMIGDRPRPLMLVGYKERKESTLHLKRQSNFDTLGASFYDWQGGNAVRVIWFMRVLGIDYFRPATVEEQRSVINEAESMPLWPEAGSVAETNGVTIIKLGGFNGSQLFTFIDEEKPCGAGDRTSFAACRTAGNWHPGNHARHDGISIVEPHSERPGTSVVFDLQQSPGFLTLENAKIDENHLAYPGSAIHGEGASCRIGIAALDELGREEVELRLQIHVPEASSLTLHYRYDNEDVYSPQHSVNYHLERGENNLVFLIPGELLTQKLLITPVNDDLPFVVDQLTVAVDDIQTTTY